MEEPFAGGVFGWRKRVNRQRAGLSIIPPVRKSREGVAGNADGCPPRVFYSQGEKILNIK
jgi:hypothetical protein